MDKLKDPKNTYVTHVCTYVYGYDIKSFLCKHPPHLSYVSTDEYRYSVSNI